MTSATPPGPPPGWYRASDGRDYPVPPGQYLASDGRLYPLPTQPASPDATAPPGWRWTAASGLLLAGAAAAVIGALLPWATVGPFSASGMDGDGVLTLPLGIACGVVGAFAVARASRGLAITALVAALLIAVIAVVDLADVNSVADGPFGLEAEVGGGLILTLLAGLAAALGGVLAIRDARRSAG